MENTSLFSQWSLPGTGPTAGSRDGHVTWAHHCSLIVTGTGSGLGTGSPEHRLKMSIENSLFLLVLNLRPHNSRSIDTHLPPDGI